MKHLLVIATYSGFARFDAGTVQFVEEAKDASVFKDPRSANEEAQKHGLVDGFILVDASREVATVPA